MPYDSFKFKMIALRKALIKKNVITEKNIKDEM